MGDVQAGATPATDAGRDVAGPIPVYDDGTVALYHGDMRSVLPALAAQTGIGRVPVDAVLADPPYNETNLEWDRWPAGWLDVLREYTPVTAPLWCFGSFRMFLDRAADFERWQFAQDIVWKKHNGSSSAADRFRRVHELVAQFYRGPWSAIYTNPVTTPDAVKKQVRRKKRPPQWGDSGGHAYQSEDGGPRLALSVQEVRSCHGYAVHPTQKPEGLVDPLLRYSVPPGGAVLDPFAGSSTTLLVAKQLGMKAIGIEADERYIEVSLQRLAQGVLVPLETVAAASPSVVSSPRETGVSPTRGDEKSDG